MYIYTHTYLVCNKEQLFNRSAEIVLQTLLQPCPPQCIGHAVKKLNKYIMYMHYVCVYVDPTTILCKWGKTLSTPVLYVPTAQCNRGTQYIVKTNLNQWHHDLRLDATTFSTLTYMAGVPKEQNFQCFHRFCVILKNQQPQITYREYCSKQLMLGNIRQNLSNF